MRSKTQAVLRYLAERRDYCFLHGEPWEGDDYAVAYLIVLYAKRGEADPMRRAFLRYYGVHPEQLHLRILERRQAWIGPQPEPRKPVVIVPQALAKKQSA